MIPKGIGKINIFIITDNKAKAEIIKLTKKLENPDFLLNIGKSLRGKKPRRKR